MDIKPQAMAIPKDTSTLPQGKYGPIFPRTPACYGFTIIAKIIPGREPVFYEYAAKHRESRGGNAELSGAAQASLSSLGPLSHRWRDLLYVLRASSIRISTSTQKTRLRCSSVWA